ncbi:MAG TPA: GMC family oxidoreductase [Actinomycetota bacterium]|nr:GMC family oxidoreductase [Actinomycetota bacterium]
MKRAIVVGSGAAGSTVARLLAKSGNYSVLILEKGRNYFTGLGGPIEKIGNLFSNDEVGWESRRSPIVPDPFLEPRSFRTSTGSGKRTFVGDVNGLPTTVGGGTVHYDAKARRFREVDFITNSLMGGTPDKPAIPGTTYSDWAMEYRHFEPFYAVMEEIVGVQGPARRDGRRIVNPNPYESWRSTPYPMPPGVAQLNSLLPSEAADRLGYHAAPVPTSVNSRPYRGRPACVDCGFCLHYGCPINAKGGGVWQLHDALSTGRAELRSEVNVLRVEYAKVRDGKFRATGVTYITPDGRSHTARADLVVLANSPIEAARLSFVSGIGQGHPNEKNIKSAQPTETDPSGMLGRNLMFHLQTIVLAIVNQPIHSYRGRTSTHTLDAFAGAGPSANQFNEETLRAGILEIGGNLNPVVEANEVAAFAYGEIHKQFMKLGPFHNHLTTFTLQGEDMPQITNYVDLDPDIVDVYGIPVPRVTYQSHPYELAASAFYTPLMLEIMETIGGPGSAHPTVQTLAALALNTTLPPALPGQIDAPVQQILSATPFNEIPASAHIMGTHRAALQPQHGPCDPYGRYWAFDNLYHAGGGLYATAPGYNVTLTIWALSYIVGSAIVSGVGGRGGYSKADIDRDHPRLLDVIKKLDRDTMIARAL